MHTSLAWVPRGKSVAHPRKYELDENELQRVEKLAKIRLEDAQFDLEAAEAEERAAQEGDDWEECVLDSAFPALHLMLARSEDSDASKDEDDAMEGVEQAAADPNDLSAYKLDDYDDERTRQARAYFAWLHGHRRLTQHSFGRLWQHSRTAIPPKRSRRSLHHDERGASTLLLPAD